MNKNKEDILVACNTKCKNTLMEALSIEFVDILDDCIIARMPVSPKVHQPDGLLHGGASVALAETVGSMATFILLENEDINIRAIEISANHVKSVRGGYVYAKAKLIHKGRTTQLWHIPITNEEGQLISMVKLTTITLRT